MGLLLAGTLLAASSAGVMADYGGYKYNNLGTRLHHRYDFELSNTTEEIQEVSVCPDNVEVFVHDHRIESETAFAVRFGDAVWSYDCATRSLAPGESVMLSTYFDEWWGQ